MGQSRVFRLRAAALKNSGFFKVLLLLTAAAVSGISHAAIFTYYAFTNPVEWVDSASAACAAFDARYTANTGLIVLYSVQPNGDAVCKEYYPPPNQTIAMADHIQYASKITCTDPNVLNYTTRQCEAPPPPPPVVDCSSKIGHSSTVMLKCYEAVCSGGWVLDPDGKIGCNSGVSFVSQAIPASIPVDGCPAAFQSMNQLSPKIQKSAVGSTTPQDIYCQVTYVVTGGPPPADPLTPPPVPPADSDLASPGTGTGGAAGSGANSGSGTSAQSPGPNGDGSGTAGAMGSPCVPTATVPCTGSGVGCVPSVGQPCTSSGSGVGKCIPTPVEPCSDSGGSTTSDCELSPVCTGDGIQCAQVIQTWKSMCETKKALTDIPDAVKASLAAISDAGNASSVGSDSSVSSQQSSFTTQIQTVQNLINGLNSSASCLPDISLSVLGRSVVIPLTSVCSLLELLRLLLHISVDLVCVRILASPFLGK